MAGCDLLILRSNDLNVKSTKGKKLVPRYLGNFWTQKKRKDRELEKLRNRVSRTLSSDKQTKKHTIKQINCLTN
jgi:predicted metal-binding protein